MKPKINTNREPLSEKDIEKGKNFKTVYQNYYKIPKPLYKNKKFLGAIIIISILTLVLILDSIESNKSSNEVKTDSLQTNTNQTDTIKQDTIN